LNSGSTAELQEVLKWTFPSFSPEAGSCAWAKTPDDKEPSTIENNTMRVRIESSLRLGVAGTGNTV